MFYVIIFGSGIGRALSVHLPRLFAFSIKKIYLAESTSEIMLESFLVQFEFVAMAASRSSMLIVDYKFGLKWNTLIIQLQINWTIMHRNKFSTLWMENKLFQMPKPISINKSKCLNTSTIIISQRILLYKTAKLFTF